MEPSTATLLSYICLLIVSIYCLQSHVSSAGSEFGTIAYGIMVACSSLGAWRAFDASTMPGIVAEAQKHLELFSETFILSFAAAELWAKERIRIEIVYLQLTVPLVPVILHIANKDFTKAADYVILGSIISYITASILCACVNGILAAGFYAANVYYVKEKKIIEAIPPKDMMNYVACIFSLALLSSLENY